MINIFRIIKKPVDITPTGFFVVYVFD